jgi:hypothetical protein
MTDIIKLVNDYGFPVIASGGLAYMIYYVWSWATKEVKPIVKEASTVLIALVDRVRSLDNDLIRLNQKVDVILQLRSRAIEQERKEAEERINRTP